MDAFTIFFLSYMFIGLYLMILLLIAYLKNFSIIYENPIPNKLYEVTAIVPVYNKGNVIIQTLDAIKNIDYAGLKKIIIVDDNSTDDSYEKIKENIKDNSKFIVVRTPKNTGCAGGAINYGMQFAKTEIVAVIDSDSMPRKDSISKMVGYFNESNTGSVTSSILVENRNKFFCMAQSLEYKVIAFTRKLLGYMDAIYVCPGPLALYRKSVLDKIGGFDEKNMTEDIEMSWRIAYHGYGREMALDAQVYTFVPEKFKEWIRQRVRWNLGGFQTIYQYRKTIFKKNILGLFIIPYFVSSMLIGLAGLLILTYRLIKGFIVDYWIVRYSLPGEAANNLFGNINLTPSIVNIYGVVMFLIGLMFTLFALSKIREDGYKKANVFNLSFYLLIYLMIYPFLMIYSFYKLIRKNYSW